MVADNYYVARTGPNFVFLSELILSAILMYMVCASFSCFLWLVKG